MKIKVRNRCSDYDSYRAARVKSLFNCESGANFSLDATLPDDDELPDLGLLHEDETCADAVASAGRSMYRSRFAKVPPAGEPFPSE